jgi:serine/threonine protein kinase
MTPSQHFSPPAGQFGQRPMATPPPEVQPTFPPPAVTSESPPPSEQVQRRPAYLLHRDLVIGKGSYGQVCIASRGESEGHTNGRSGKRKKFACKCVMLRNDPKYISKLQEEVNVLRELRGHDNVIRLYDVFCVDNELFIITELGRGGDLFHLLTTHPKHGVTEAYAGKSTRMYKTNSNEYDPILTIVFFINPPTAKTVVEMLSSVAFLHSRNICHRDLKLENWVLESGKDVWSPLKLIDFGLSTHFAPGQRLSRVVGSSYYVAPEVLKKSYTEACDLWSLGVIVYMLLSGAPPFYGKNDEAIKASIVQGEYTFPHELFRDVSDEAMAFVSTLLSYNIEYRYTAEQALTHPWLAANLDPQALQRAKDGARGVGIVVDTSRPEPMQL